MRRKNRKNRPDNLLATTLLALILSCLSTAAWSAATLVKDVGFSPTSVDPGYGTTLGDTNLLADLFEGLYTYNRSDELVLGQAESHEISNDGLVHTFVLRDDIFWSDGEPVVAQDFANGIYRILTKREGEAMKPTYLLDFLSGVSDVLQGTAPLANVGITVLSPKSLRYTLRSPVTFFNDLLSKNAFYPVPTHIINSVHEDWISAEHFVGNGAYTISDYNSQSATYQLEKNPYYRFADEVYYDRVDIVSIAPMEKLESQLATGKIDVVSIYAGEKNAEWFKTELDATMTRSAFNGTGYIQLNWKVEPLGEQKIRQAIALVVPREELYRRIYDADTTRIAYTFAVPSSSANWHPEKPAWAEVDYETRLDLAKQLMRESGYGPANRLALEFLFQEKTNGSFLANALKAALASIWIDIEPQGFGIAQYFDKFLSHDFEIVFMSYSAYFDDPLSFYPILDSNSAEGIVSWNVPEYDNKLAELLNADVNTNRIALINEIENIIKERIIVIPLYYISDILILRQGLTSSPMKLSNGVLSKNIWPIESNLK